ncbi:MAG: enoyl-CoA hydratase-related protein [Actinomycetes bacterium]
MTESTNGMIRELSDGVLWLTIDRPEAGNALNADTREQLVEALRDASDDLLVRCVVLTGAGEKAFCTGADLRNQRPPRERPEGAPERAQGEAARLIQRGWQELVISVLDCEKPVIGAINGTAAGGGMHLALACDLVVAADTARFIEVFIRRGIAPDAAGAWLLTRLVGIQRAKELFFLGDEVSASDALAMGLVNRVVAPGDLVTTARGLADRLAASPTRAIAITKAITNRALDVDRASALLDEAWGQELVTTTHDMREGISAFVERRSPNFKGW